MAKNERRHRLYNRILSAVGFAVLALLTFWTFAGRLPAALALEQETRCGMEEHIHTEGCYMGDVLVCGSKAHIHSETCYLILLEDNDVNQLLTAVENNKTKSLEGVIEDALIQALAANGIEAATESDLSFVGGSDNTEADASPSVSRDSIPSPSVSEDAEPSSSRAEDPEPNPGISESSEPFPSRPEDSVPSPSRTEAPEPDPSVSEDTEPSPSKSEDSVPSPSRTDDPEPDPSVSEDVEPSPSKSEDSVPSPSRTDDPEPNPSVSEDDAPLPSKSEDVASVTGETDATAAEEKTDEVASLALANLTVTDLNTTIVENQIQPSLTLNKSLYAVNTQPSTESGNGGISTLAVGQNPVTGTRRINFYIRLDGTIVCINSGTLRNSNPDYYSYANTVSAYNTITITNLTTSNINSTYHFRYNTDGNTSTSSDFDSNASYRNSNVQFGNGSSARYAILTTKSNYTPVDFYTVTLDYSATDPNRAADIQYVEKGLDSALTLSEDYDWVDADGNTVDASDLENITAKTTLRAIGLRYKVTFNSNGGSDVQTQRVSDGGKADMPAEPTRAGFAFAGWYSDAELTLSYDFNTEVDDHITLYAKWIAETRTIRYYDSNENLLNSVTVDYGSAYTLLEVPDGQVWYSGDDIYAGTIDPVTSNLDLYAGVVATFSCTNGTVVKVPAKPGATIILPTSGVSGSSLWMDAQGNTHQPGDGYVLTESTGFVEQRPLTIVYNLNFSDSGLNDSANTPTLAENGQTTATIEIPMGSSAAIFSVSPRTYISSNSGEAAHFVGWVPEGAAAGIYIQPGTVLTWDVLNQYAVDGTITLNGDWNRDSTNNITDVRFYVRFDSVAPDISGNVGSYGTNYYTSQIHHAYAGNSPAYNSGFSIADKTADNSYAADQAIRALVGDKGDGELWISSVPDDAWLFEQLKEFTYENATDTERQNNQYLRIHIGTDANGNDLYETVPADELDADHYSLRWYVFKKEGDGWHIDGRLVKKEGTITVDKIFGGIEDAVNQAREGFYILAENGTVTDGVFTPYLPSDLKYNVHVLTLDQQTAAALESQYPNAIFQVYDQEVNADGEIIDKWLITEVELNEYWLFTEMATKPQYTDPNSGAPKYYSWYAEYTISDSDGVYSEISRFGSVAPVLGKTYALDKDPDQGLTLDFTNYYYDNESILIRKIDGDTGLPLGGAEFQLWQGGQQLYFSDNGTGIYSVSPDGSIGSIVTNSEGFSVITVDSFSYANGELVIKEVTAPTGYAVVNDITVDYLNGTDGTAGIVDIVGVADPADYSYYADYHDENGGVLVVRDHAAVLTSVTVNKVWAEAITEDSVTVVLQADGTRATNVFPSLSNAEITLNADNGWTHTWQQLPAYANGELVNWSVKEVKIGTETTMVGSDTFANWIVVYSTPVQTDSDADGITDNWAVTVTNTVRRTMINGIKIDADNGAALSGAMFTLTEVEWNSATSQWEDKVGVPTLTAESGSDGRLLFDGLTAGSFYRLTETRPPNGYIPLLEPVYLTVSGMGVICGVTDGVADTATLDTGLVTYAGPYVINIENIAPTPLPETGGAGTHIYTGTGALLLAAALVLFVYEKRRREGIPDA